jgi:hypothetical protein
MGHKPTFGRAIQSDHCLLAHLAPRAGYRFCDRPQVFDKQLIPIISQDATTACLQCDKNATSAKQIAGGGQELCILRLLRLPCAIYSFILFQQARAVFIRDGSVAETYWLAHFAA